MIMREEYKILIDKETLSKRVKDLASRIKKDFSGKKPVLLCVLKGAVIFFTDLIRELDIDIDLDFVRLSSYKNGTKSSGKVTFGENTSIDLKGRDVIVVEDIIDSGRTLSFYFEYLKNIGVNSVKGCVLLDKPSRREVDVKMDYVGFEIEDLFVVGYGLDYAEKYRNLKDVCVLEFKD